MKDRAMADAAEYGLMLWDGKSKGTVNNVVNLSRDHKPVVVYIAPTKQFRTIKAFDDIKGLLAQGDSDSVETIVGELHCMLRRHVPPALCVEISSLGILRPRINRHAIHGCGSGQ
jgi:hypothetical protein